MTNFDRRPPGRNAYSGWGASWIIIVIIILIGAGWGWGWGGWYGRGYAPNTAANPPTAHTNTGTAGNTATGTTGTHPAPATNGATKP